MATKRPRTPAAIEADLGAAADDSQRLDLLTELVATLKMMLAADQAMLAVKDEEIKRLGEELARVDYSRSQQLEKAEEQRQADLAEKEATIQGLIAKNERIKADRDAAEKVVAEQLAEATRIAAEAVAAAQAAAELVAAEEASGGQPET